LPVIKYGIFRTLSFWAILPFFFLKIAKRFGPFDLVHGNGISDLTLWKKMTRIPRLVTVHHLSSTAVQKINPSLLTRLSHPGDETGILPFLEPISFKRADKIIAVSDDTRVDLIQKLKIDPSKICVLRHGTNPTDYIFPEEELMEIRKRLDLIGKPFVLFVGRLEARKGPDVLIEAVSEVLKTLDIGLILAGSGDSKPYLNLAAKKNILEKIRFLGFVDDVILHKLYAACDLFVFPSRMEGFGLVALEARAAGKFIVASNVGGIPEAVPSGAGILVPPEEPLALANAIIKALSERHIDLPKTQTWKEVCVILCGIYQGLINRSQGAIKRCESR
jgi:glycosyltransferase involved in cell wall biosynthesis